MNRTQHDPVHDPSAIRMASALPCTNTRHLQQEQSTTTTHTDVATKINSTTRPQIQEQPKANEVASSYPDASLPQQLGNGFRSLDQLSPPVISDDKDDLKKKESVCSSGQQQSDVKIEPKMLKQEHISIDDKKDTCIGHRDWIFKTYQRPQHLLTSVDGGGQQPIMRKRSYYSSSWHSLSHQDSLNLEPQQKKPKRNFSFPAVLSLQVPSKETSSLSRNPASWNHKKSKSDYSKDVFAKLMGSL